MTQFLGERVPGGWVDATLPRAAAIFGIAANAVLKIGREHAQPMVDRARLACSVGAELWLPACAPRELGDVVANNLTRDVIGIASRCSQLKKCARPSA